MPLWQDANGNIHDDDNGKALSLSNWPMGLTQLSAPPPPTLAQAQASQLALLAAAYQNAIQQAVSYASKGGITKTYQADSISQDVLNKELAVYTPAGATPAGYYWVSSDNSPVPFTLADLQGLAAAMGVQGWAAFQHLQTQKAAVNAATTVAQVQVVAW